MRIHAYQEAGAIIGITGCAVGRVVSRHGLHQAAIPIVDVMPGGSGVAGLGRGQLVGGIIGIVRCNCLPTNRVGVFQCVASGIVTVLEGIVIAVVRAGQAV